MQLKYTILSIIILILAIVWQYEKLDQDEILEQEIKNLNKSQTDINIMMINKDKLDEQLKKKNVNILSNNNKSKEQRQKDYDDDDQMLNIDKLIDTYQDYCIKDYAQKPTELLNQKEKLDAFIKGPCSPAIMVPGIMGTTLQILIDCETLKKEEPSIFAGCGWETCSSYRLFQKKPKQEYTIWIGGLNNPGSQLYFGREGTEKSQCFGNLLSLRRSKNSTSDYDMYESPKGLTVTFKGNTDSTRPDSRCGNTGIEDLFSMPHLQFIECAFKGFRNMIRLYDAMGYQPGITYQSLPYDFREGVWQVPTAKQIKKSLKNLKKYTGKKVNLITHSYGSLHAHYALAQYEQDFKDKHINTWIPTGAPFSGAPQILKNHLNCNDNFIDNVFSFMGRSLQIGMQFRSQKMLTQSSASLFDLYPKDVQDRHKDTPWMKEILERAEYEQKTLQQKQKYDQDKIPLSYFPNTDKICKPPVEGEHKYCQTYLYDMLKEPIMSIDQDKYYLTTKDLDQMLDKYSILDGTMETFKENWQETFLNLTNPGVKVANIYGAFGVVNTSYKYKEDPRPYTERGEYYFPEVESSTFGDMTVSTNSALTGPIKWLWEHENKSENKNHKPVKMIELCSAYKIIQDYNDEIIEKTGEKTFTKSGYGGLECQCFYTENYDDCEHSCMINDPYYLQMIANISITNEISQYKDKMPDYIQNLNHFDITEIMLNCPNLYEVNE